MPDLEPITREEMLLDGEDLTPITRKEMFIKRIYDKTQSVPEPITREEMFLKKAGEGSGGDVTIEQLDVSENGTYSESGKAYSPVVVNVPQPTIEDLTINANGEYTAPSGKAYGKVTANVPAPANALYKQTLSNLPSPIATFTGADAPLDSLKASIVGIQSGSGDPSPTNIRPISGWSSCEVTDNNDTYTIPFKDSSDNPIELYDGSVNITGDDWTGKKYKLEFDGSVDEDWQLISSGNYPYFRIKLTNGELLKANSLLCNRYTPADIRGATSNIGVGLNISGNSFLNVRPDEYSTMTLETFKTWLASNQLQVVVELASDMTGSHTPIAIRSNGVTIISVDCGEVTECKYYSDNP